MPHRDMPQPNPNNPASEIMIPARGGAQIGHHLFTLRRMIPGPRDQIANEGVLFETAFATSSWTPPSHASLVIGPLSYEYSVEWYRKCDSSYLTLAEALCNRVYRSAASLSIRSSSRGARASAAVCYQDVTPTVRERILDYCRQSLYGSDYPAHRRIRFRGNP